MTTERPQSFPLDADASLPAACPNVALITWLIVLPLSALMLVLLAIGAIHFHEYAGALSDWLLD